MAHFDDHLFNPMPGLSDIQKRHTYELYGHVLEVTREQKHRLELEENELKRQQAHYLHDMKREKTILEKELKDIKAKTRPFQDPRPSTCAPEFKSKEYPLNHPEYGEKQPARLLDRRRSEHDILHRNTGSEYQSGILDRDNINGSHPTLTAFSVASNYRTDFTNLLHPLKNGRPRSSTWSAANTGQRPQAKYWFDPSYGIQPRTMYRIKKANMVTSTLDHHHATTFQYRKKTEPNALSSRDRNRSYSWGNSSPGRQNLPSISKRHSDLTYLDVHNSI
ncbi:uncharacterized protein LOC106174200 [Lingula anatina]|uniref:Uncharacterized protein LOC106174200 n=1 Tax=Lingula anatina TaxID=7574 RepID=A0A1S3JL33_LINAN|nr:uncharacterized protein LOC106174200 [Lingula anatina]|eukprot:XP_013411088.1 uncharacterized protein LOC106174200 [Lingula anatina]